MLRVAYNPFPVEIDALLPEHLSILRGVAEGWYVEYKRAMVDASKIAKSISAFANHYGGWLFYGVAEADNEINKAVCFPGIKVSDLPKFVQCIRDAVKDSIQPTPYFEHKVLLGPCDAIDLPEGQAIIAIMIPAGPNPPYIHRSGLIYRRVADASDPKKETDRFVLDELWKRGQQARQKLAEFLSGHPISPTEEETAYIQVFLMTDPLGGIGRDSNLSFDQFAEVMSQSEVAGLSIPCDNHFTFAGGYIGRYVSDNDPCKLTFTWKHYRNGSSAVSIPLSSTSATALEPGGWLHGYEHEAVIVKLLKHTRHNAGQILDLNQLAFAVSAVLAQQRRLMAQGGIESMPLYGKVSLHNMWRRIPFLDTDAYVRFITKHGFPVIQDSSSFVPPDTSFESLMPMQNKEMQTEEEALITQIENAGELIISCLNALGIPNSAIVEEQVFEDEHTIATAVFRYTAVERHRSTTYREQASQH